MIIDMTQVELAGRSAQLPALLAALQRLRVAEVVAGPEDLSAVAVSVEPAIETVRAVLYHASTPCAAVMGPVDVRGGLALAEDLLPTLSALAAEEESLSREEEALTQQVAVLSALASLVPQLAVLDEQELQMLGLASVALVLDDPDGRVVALLIEQLDALLDNRHVLVTTASGMPQLSEGSKTTVGCLLVLPLSRLEEVQALLGADRVARVQVAEAFAGHSLRMTVSLMRQRLAELPAAQIEVGIRRQQLLGPHLAVLQCLLLSLRAEAERERAAVAAVHTRRTFVLRVWVTTPRLDEVTAACARLSVVAAEVGPGQVWGEPPVLLRPRRGWGPYQRLVSFLSWPAPGQVDPSGLMAVVLPFLFGVMVGDVVYGLVLMGLGWFLMRRGRSGQQAFADAGQMLVVGGAWATVFGVLFGEALGNLGRSLGMPALWFYRGGPAALEPLLLFALAIGAAHVVLGLILGVWTAIRNRQLGRLLDRGGTLLVLVGLLGLVGVLADALPAGLLTPTVIATVIGVVIACLSHGAIGLLLGPLELLGSLGNVLSYLRVAAVGLASVYLANVANTLGAEAPLVLGIVVATFLHALNLALAAFSPTVQALRLHYVEFFSKFYDGGGRPFAPLGAGLELPAEAPEPALTESAAEIDPEPPLLDRVHEAAATSRRELSWN